MQYQKKSKECSKMKMFLRVLMAVVIAINSIAGTSLTLVACECEHGMHIELSKNHCCTHSHSNSEADEISTHEHCHDFILAGFSESNFSDTSELAKLKNLPDIAPLFLYQYNFELSDRYKTYQNSGGHIKTSPPRLIPSAKIQLLI